MSVSFNMNQDERGNYHVSSALTVGGRRQPRTTGPASECVSYYLDAEGNKVNARIFRAATERKHNRSKTVVVVPNRKITAADLAPIFAD